MESRALQRQHGISRFDIGTREETVPLDGADCEAGKVVHPPRIDAGQLRGLAAGKGTSRQPAPLDNSPQDIEGMVGVQATGGKVVQKEQWLRTLHQKIIDRHRDQIDPDPVVSADSIGQQELGSYPVGGCHQQRIPESFTLKVENRPEPAENRVGTGACRRSGERRQAGYQLFRGIDIDARTCIGVLLGTGHRGSAPPVARNWIRNHRDPRGRRRDGALLSFILHTMGEWARHPARWATAAYLLVAAGSINAPAAAQDIPDVYIVRGITVDEYGADGSAAREAALRAGERAAFSRLLQWLLLEQDAGRVPEEVRLDPARFVNGYSIENERVASDRYQATLEVQFDPNEVRGLLGQLGLTFEERRPPPHVLIPVLRQNGRLSLWDDNPWLDAWAGRDGSVDFIPLLVPHGEVGDLATLAAADAAAATPDRIAGLARRYGVTHALLAVADRTLGGNRLEVSVRLTDQGHPLAEPLRLRLTGTPDESGWDLLRRAAMTITRAAADLWIRSMHARRDADGSLSVRAEFGSFSEWRRIRTELGRSSRLGRVTIQRLSTHSSDLLLEYSGPPDAVHDVLAAAGLDVETEGDPWTLRWPLVADSPPSEEELPESPDQAAPPAQPVVD